MHSSTSIAMRLRYSIADGFIRLSPSEIVGNSRGSAPACSTPRFTASASPRKWMLQLTSSDQELQIPITGRPDREYCEMPCAWMAVRWTKPVRSRGLNQRALLSCELPLVLISCQRTRRGRSIRLRPRSMREALLGLRQLGVDVG